MKQTEIMGPNETIPYDTIRYNTIHNKREICKISAQRSNGERFMYEAYASDTNLFGITARAKETIECVLHFG